MSLAVPCSLRCPSCGNEQETMVWESVNVTLDPELKEKLFRAEINLFSCEKCGEESLIDTPLLYNDMTAKVCVQYYPSAFLEDPDFFQSFNSDGSRSTPEVPKEVAEVCAYISRPHVVFDLREMLRYVTFRDLIADKKAK